MRLRKWRAFYAVCSLLLLLLLKTSCNTEPDPDSSGEASEPGPASQIGNDAATIPAQHAHQCFSQRFGYNGAVNFTSNPSPVFWGPFGVTTLSISQNAAIAQNCNSAERCESRSNIDQFFSGSLFQCEL